LSAILLGSFLREFDNHGNHQPGGWIPDHAVYLPSEKFLNVNESELYITTFPTCQ
jgi:hypothetical protein